MARLIEEKYNEYKNYCNEQFMKLKTKEEELNRIFIENYGLKEELTPYVDDKNVSVHYVVDKIEDASESLKKSGYLITKYDVIVDFISYSVGCMFGRYSLDEEGLIFAGGEWDSSKYQTFKPDSDNIIPICDDEYFDDDIVENFIKFVEIVYGKETLEANLKFIAESLGGKDSSREVIRKYFLNSFYIDHLKKFQKRPIYWLFDSGKKNGFKALIYMHRYTPDLLAKIRTDYVHEQQERYRTQIKNFENEIIRSDGTSKIKMTKQLEKIKSQSEEILKFEEKLHHLADQMIEIDLDDGVKVNYGKLSEVLYKIV